MLVAELFFGRGVKGREPLTDAEWADFAARTITPKFPDGFTVFDGDGQWRNPQTGHIAGSRTKVLVIAAKREPDLARRLAAVIDAYKTEFHQQSVGIPRLVRRVLAGLRDSRPNHSRGARQYGWP